jgi:hypothetical protein
MREKKEKEVEVEVGIKWQIASVGGDTALLAACFDRMNVVKPGRTT